MRILLNFLIFLIPICSFFIHSTKGQKDFISMEQFVHFMNDKQRDPRMNEILYPLYEEKRCTEIINDYELDEERKKNCK